MTCILLLGGTAEARALAEQLVAAGVEVTTSLAGRVVNPRLPVGEVRTWPKMLAAGELGLPVVILRRPARPAGVQTAYTIEAAVAWAL